MSSDSGVALAAVLGLAFIAVAALIPVRIAIPLAVAAFVALPLGYMNVSSVLGRNFTPSVLLLFAVEIRGLRRAAMGRSAIDALLVAFVFCLLLVSILSAHPLTTVKWCVVVIVTIVLPIRVGPRLGGFDVERLIRISLACAGAFVGIVALLEIHGGYNPWFHFFSTVYQEQTWSVPRAKASLGSPLLTMAVTSTCFVSSAFAAVKRRSGWYAAAALLSATGEVLSVSRTGELAMAIGLAVGLVPLLISREFRARAVLAIAVAVPAGLYYIANSSLLKERSASADGVTSTLYRNLEVVNAEVLIRNHPLVGVGPGSASNVYQATFGGPLENSALQFVVDLGIPTFLLFAAVLIAAVYRGLSTNRPEMAGALCAFLVALVGYNAGDSNPAIFFLGGILVLAIMSPISSSAITNQGNAVEIDARNRLGLTSIGA